MAGQQSIVEPSKIPAEALTVLTAPADPALDILLVHGFTGHPYGTWAYKRGVQSQNEDDDPQEPPAKSRRHHLFSRPRETLKPVYWPTDLLPNDIPGARIVAYGYNTHLRHKFIGPPPSKTSVYDIAWDLLMALEAERRSAPERPLLLIAHSLGGIVVKEMLRQSQTRSWEDDLRRVGSSTIGMVFFGTPHSGADHSGLLVSMAKALAKSCGFTVDQRIVDCLMPSSERLRQLRDEFPQIAIRREWVIHSFQEQYGLTSLGGDKVVDDTSSRLSLPQIQRSQHIAADHMGMCRFHSQNDVEYRKLVAALDRIIAHSAHTQNSQSTQRYPGADQCKTIIEALQFEQMGSRHTGIRRAHSRTCRWFMSMDEYQSWTNDDELSDHNGILWIKGNPGTGKSTLMKFLLNQARAGHGTTAKKQVISFFFHARGGQLERSTPGMYRHLLCQILQEVDSEGIVRIIAQMVDNTGLSNWKPNNWTVDVLSDLLRAAVLSVQRRIICFIDALDECDHTEIREMLKFFLDLGESSVKRGFPLQVCFSSRHYPQISFNKGLSLKLEGQEGHERDIQKYLETELNIGNSSLAQRVRAEVTRKASGIFMWVVLVTQLLIEEYDRGKLHTLEDKLDEIPDDLHGLFERIILRDPHDQDDLLLVIQWILFAKKPLTPRELYFATLSGSKHGGYPHGSTLDPSEITEDDIHRRIVSSSKGLAEVTSTKMPVAQFIHESVRDYLLRDGGLGKLWQHLGPKVPGLSHDVLKTCCLNYIQAIPPTSLLQPAARNRAKSRLKARDDSVLIRAKAPFLEYALKHLIYHANSAQLGGVSQAGLLSSFPKDLWIEMHNMINPYVVRNHTTKASLLYILAEQDAAALIAIHPGPEYLDDPVSSCWERYGLPIVAAIAHGNHAAVGQLLLSQFPASNHTCLTSLCRDICPVDMTSANTHRYQSLGQKYDGRRTLLEYLFDYGHLAYIRYYLLHATCTHVPGQAPGQWRDVFRQDMGAADIELLSRQFDLFAKDGQGDHVVCVVAAQGMVEVMQKLVTMGWSVSDHKDRGGMTPLSRACQSGRTAMVKFLLDMDEVNINARSRSGRTPLFYAAEAGRVENVKLLLEVDEVNVNARSDSDETPLMRAAEYGSVEIVKLLIDSGKTLVNAVDRRGESALSVSIKMRRVEVVEVLLNTDKVDFHQERVIREAKWAISRGWNPVLQQLLLGTGFWSGSTAVQGGLETKAQGGLERCHLYF